MSLGIIFKVSAIWQDCFLLSQLKSGIIWLCTPSCALFWGIQPFWMTQHTTGMFDAKGMAMAMEPLHCAGFSETQY